MTALKTRFDAAVTRTSSAVKRWNRAVEPWVRFLLDAPSPCDEFGPVHDAVFRITMSIAIIFLLPWWIVPVAAVLAWPFFVLGCRTLPGVRIVASSPRRINQGDAQPEEDFLSSGREKNFRPPERSSPVLSESDDSLVEEQILDVWEEDDSLERLVLSEEEYMVLRYLVYLDRAAEKTKREAAQAAAAAARERELAEWQQER